MSEIVVRQAAPADEKFLRDVYFSSRLDEVSAFGWNPAQQAAFLDMQFRVRQQAYKIQYPNADYSIIVFGGNDAGSLIVDRSDNGICLTDVAVLPEFRGKGIATYLIGQLQSEAAAKSKLLVLQVDKTNVAARRLYEKLNFVVSAEGQHADEMEWKAGT
ncbi:MAG: GNAT family N-acetyltransferase [Pyrinomonadaceae bacterium]|nr:N-acetyltransferase [Chloracidobacterium sp.]